MAWTDLFGLNKPEEEVPEQEVAEPAPQPQYATVEQMQQMVQGVASQLQENLVGLMRGGNQQEQPTPTYQTIPEPTLDQINEAFEEGDTKKALQLQAQREAAREQRYNAQLYQLRHEGQQAFAEVNQQLMTNQVPDYKRYEKEVQKKLDELGIKDVGYRNNPAIVKLVTNAVKGEKIDEIIAERQEAEKRRANDAETGDPTSSRRGQYSAQPKPVMSEEAELALRFAGKDKEQFAKSRGHGSWSDYEKSAAAFQAVKRGEGNYVPKWRRK